MKKLLNVEFTSNEKTQKGYFHRWFRSYSESEKGKIRALIENLEGKMESVSPGDIVFTGKSSNPDEDRNPVKKEMVM